MRTFNRNLQKSVSFIVILTILLNILLPKAIVAFSSESGGKIDLFTQKTPYEGKGENMPSDAFALDEEVKIFAYVTYNGWPENGLPVALQVFGPENSTEEISFCRTMYTNESGIAVTTFRIPNVKHAAFGEWNVIGNTRIADLTVQDKLSFKVGFPVEIVSIKTVNEGFLDQSNFTKESFVGVELTLRSITLTEKKPTITIAIYDSAEYCINSKEEIDFSVPPDDVIISFHCFMHIPKNARLGNATIFACAYDAPISFGGIPYCPEVTCHFMIVNLDLAILSIQLSHRVIYQGEAVRIDVCAENMGWESRSFIMKLYVNSTLIDQATVTDLPAFSNFSVSFLWNTSSVGRGIYLISASIDRVLGETNTFNNMLSGGFVKVELPYHEVLILNVFPSSASFYKGDAIDVYVIVKNQGNFTESFEVTLFYGSNVVDTILFDSLQPNCQSMLSFHWDTQNVGEGKYTLSANVTQVPGEENFENNYYTDGTVYVFVALDKLFIPHWFYFFLLPLMILVVLLIVGWLHVRARKEKEARDAFYSGWRAWYARKSIDKIDKK